MDKKEALNIYDINISGDGGNQVAHEISRETYEYFSKNNELLINHIVYNEEVPDDVHIGDWYDCTSVYEIGDRYEMSCFTMTIEGNGESFQIDMSEKELEKLGVKIIKEEFSLEDRVESGEIKYFLAGIQKQFSGSCDFKIAIENSFDPKKLRVIVNSFQSKNMVVDMEYDGITQAFSEIIENSEHGVWKESWDHEYEFEVIKVDRT